MAPPRLDLPGAMFFFWVWSLSPPYVYGVPVEATLYVLGNRAESRERLRLGSLAGCFLRLVPVNSVCRRSCGSCRSGLTARTRWPGNLREK